jgi:hypothetical protein
MKLNKTIAIAVLCAITASGVYAKLPAPQLSDEQKAKAEETKAKAADAAKQDGELLSKAQDRIVERYVKAQKSKGITVKQTPIAVAAAPAGPATPGPAKK